MAYGMEKGSKAMLAPGMRSVHLTANSDGSSTSAAYRDQAIHQSMNTLNDTVLNSLFPYSVKSILQHSINSPIQNVENCTFV